MDFIDEPKFGHSKFKLPVLLVPVLMFGTLILGIIASKIYVSSVLDQPHAEETNYSLHGRPTSNCFESTRRYEDGSGRILVVFLSAVKCSTFL